MELEQQRTTVQKAAGAFGAVNVAIGVLGLFGPTVENDQKGLVNTEPGRLLGFSGMNWVHALAHLGTGVAGLAAQRSGRASVAYMRGVAVMHGVLVVMGRRKVRGRDGLYQVMGMTVDRRANGIHVGWTVTGALFSRPIDAPRRMPSRGREARPLGTPERVPMGDRAASGHPPRVPVDDVPTYGAAPDR